VRLYVRECRRRREEVYVPLVHRPGESAQVDFFEVTVIAAGLVQKAWKLPVYLPFSGRTFGWLYTACDTLSFLDGHVRAFAHLGGVPARIALLPAPSQPCLSTERLPWGASRASSSRQPPRWCRRLGSKNSLALRVKNIETRQEYGRARLEAAIDLAQELFNRFLGAAA
jgi:transposase